MYTAQEHALQLGTVLPEWHSDPYKDTRLIEANYGLDGNGKEIFSKPMTLKEVNSERMEKGYFLALAQFFILYPEEANETPFVRLSLEPLDENGRTIKDPQVLDDERYGKIERYVCTNDFPYLRKD